MAPNTCGSSFDFRVAGAVPFRVAASENVSLTIGSAGNGAPAAVAAILLYWQVEVETMGGGANAPKGARKCSMGQRDVTAAMFRFLIFSLLVSMVAVATKANAAPEVATASRAPASAPQGNQGRFSILVLPTSVSMARVHLAAQQAVTNLKAVVAAEGCQVVNGVKVTEAKNGSLMQVLQAAGNLVQVDGNVVCGDGRRIDFQVNAEFTPPSDLRYWDARMSIFKQVAGAAPVEAARYVGTEKFESDSIWSVWRVTRPNLR